MTKIQQFWDCFISAESSSYDKSRWFDFFLCQFIVDLNDGYCVEDILTFCNWNGVGTLIGCELLSDVDQVCSQPGDGEDLSPLRHHLFTKGWRALVVLLSLGQQNFSCTNELASLLISLYPICLEGKGNIRRYFGADNKYVHLSTEYELDPCLPSSSLKSKFLDGHAQFTMRADYYRCHTSALSIRNKKLTRGSTSERRNKEINSSESENPNDDANLQNKSCAFKIKLEPVKHDYLKSAVQSEDYNKFDSVHYEPRRKPKLVKKASPMDWMDEKIKDVMQSQVNPYEFSVLVIQLLMSLCKSEHSIGLARDNLYPVCLKSVKFAMENLCSIQFESVSINTLNGAETCNLKYCLTQLFTISFKKIMCCSDVTSNAILTGILPMSLRVLEESVYKLISRINDVGVSSKENNSYESDTENQIIFGLICSTIQFLFNLLIQISEVDRVGNFLELFKTFIESNSGILIEKTIMVLTKFGKITKAKKVIDLIGQLIVKMKNVRQYLIKPHLSKRMKQKKCKNGSEQHHHHDLFGAVYTPVVSSNCQQNCCVSRLFLVLLNLLSNIDEMPVELINHTLKIMIFCGTCCCFTKNNILEYIIAVIKLPYHKSRVLAFQLLEGTLYPELGFYSAAKGKSTCLVCCKQSNSRWTQDNVSNNLSEECFNSGHVSFTDGYCLGQSILNLNLFKELLFSNDIRTVQGVTCHLLKSAPKMTQEGKYIVLFNIFLPVFLSEKMKFFCEKGSLSAFLLLSSLTIFSSLLNNFEFAQGFIRQKGLDVVLDLISVHRFTANCCSVLEKTILVSVLNSDSNVSNIPSVVTLRNAADAANCDFLHYFDAQESVAQIDLGDAKMKQQMTISQRKGIDVVENVFIFWRTYANLVLGNPVLRKYFSGQKFLSDCNKILKTALLSLANKEMKGKVKSMKCQENTESCMFIKLIESLLTFNLAVADYVGSGDSQEKAIIDQLSRNLLVNDLRNMDIRRLSEVLLKCSMIPPNELQINHSDSAPKFLFSPLWTTCGKGDDIEENEERSVSDSESLEDLYVTADEGYDADVEVRDTFSSPGDGFHRNTVSGIDSTAGFQFQGETGFEENSEKCGRVIVYPKLCLAAIDLLIKLYNDKIKENPERNAKSETQNSKFWETQKSNVVKPEIQVHECSIVKDPVHDKLCNFNETDMERKNSKNRLGHDETGEKHGGTENTNMIELISVFQKLTTLCREKSENCAILCNKNVILKLLKGFQSCLSEAKETLTELQKAILDFITILGKYSVTTEELSAYLSLFKGDSPPVDLLFNPLLSWVSSYGSHPTFFLRFPVSIPADFVQNATPDIGKELHIQHRSEGINSCWSLSALSLPIGPDFSWPLWTQGFSISLWIRFDKSCHSGTKQRGHSKQHRKLSKTESGLRDCNLVAVSDVPSIYSKKKSELLSPKPISTQDLLHVFSLGNDGLTLECWTAPDLEVLVWRLSRIVNHGEYEIIAEKAVQHCFSVSSWTHLAINVRNVVTRKTTLIQVTFVSNGGNEISICLALSSAPVRRSRTSSLLLGAQGTIHKKGSFFFGSLMLFTNPVFTRERAVYLLGFGPKCTSLIDCLIGRRRPNFTSIFSNKILINEIDWEKILDAKLELIRDAQNHLLMIYSAENPHTFNIYPSCSGINSAPFCSGLRSVSPETSAAQLGPICLIPSLFASLDIHKYQGLIHTAYILGGSSTFMFLFARIVELKCNPAEQGRYLFLLLKFVQCDTDLFTQFVKNEHHNMLLKIFSVSRTLSGHLHLHILKAILDACCDKPVIQYTGNRFQIVNQCDSVIVNSFLITTILSSWKDWSPALQGTEVLEMFFSALLALLKDEHPFREFNVGQLNRVKMVNGLLSFCKERFLYGDKKTLTVGICTSLVELVKSLMGAPPEFSHILAIMNCLILLHPVNTTFVTHVKSSFYMLLSDCRTFLNSGNNNENKSAKNLKDDSLKNGSLPVLESWSPNSNVNTSMKNAYQNNVKSALDICKLNRALTDLQLRNQTLDNVNASAAQQDNQELDNVKHSENLMFDAEMASSHTEQSENFHKEDEERDKSQLYFTSLFSNVGAKKGHLTEEKGDQREILTDASDEQTGDLSSESSETQWIVVEGLLLLLRDVILILPDSMEQQVLNHVIKPEILLVMANHKNHRIRSAVVKVFTSYLQRAPHEDVQKFIKLKGFIHLANQISLFPASQCLVEDCLQLLTRTVLDEHPIDFFNTASLPLILALLPRSIHDLSLAHNLINTIGQFYCKDEYASRVLLDNGLLEVLVKTLVASVHFTSGGSDETCQGVVLFDVIQLFIVIVSKLLNTSGLSNMQIISDMRLELNHAMRLEIENCGVTSRCVRAIRDALCKILDKALDVMQKKIIAIQVTHKQRKSSIFSLVLNGNQSGQAELGSPGVIDVFDSHVNAFKASTIHSYSHAQSKEVTRNELSERFKALTVYAVEFLIYSEMSKNRNFSPSRTELSFIYHLLPMLLQILSANVETRNATHRQTPTGIYWTIRDTLRGETFELLMWLMSPHQTIKVRMFALTSLISQSNCKHLLSTLLQVAHQSQQKFTVFLWDLMYNNNLSNSDFRNCQELKDSLQEWGLISSWPNGDGNDLWEATCTALISEDFKRATEWEKHMEAITVRCITKYDTLAKSLSEDATTMTRLVVDVQNVERKSFMEEMKLHYSEDVHMSIKWNELISRLTHEKAVWHFPNSYPIFWELDSTEGPSRVRKRLARCYLEMDEKYFLSSERHKLNIEKNTKPLGFLFKETAKSRASMLLIERLHSNEKIRVMFSAKIITPALVIPGELLIGEACLYFVADDRHKFHSLNASNAVWLFDDVKEIHTRRYELQERAVEFFLTNGKTYFVAFETAKERDDFMTELMDCYLPNRVTGDTLNDVMQLWREGIITNWEYLTQLNKLAGRSYNDLMQYPVYPFVLSDYCSPTIDLNNCHIYRNFKKPMAVQEKKNELHYINNYNELLGGLKHVSLNKEPYHYGSHYSNSGTVLHFLVRLPPFTKMLLHYQDGNFDLPDRTFHSLHTTWRLASSESTTDVKEMIPEFFFLPEFLTNFQRFNFGVRQNGDAVDSVLLPPWCNGDPRKFVLAHRQALESDYVTENLPHWIDLVFGYKQTGKAAIAAINVFHPATYCGFNVESIEDPVERTAWETMIKTYGQTPKQLLKTPHPFPIQSLVPRLNSCHEFCGAEVRGLKWGSYVGSPSEPEPTLVWRQNGKGKGIIGNLIALATNDILGLPPLSTCLLQYNKDRGLGVISINGVRAALLSWAFTDGIIRLQLKKELPLVPLISVSQLDPITICVSVPGCNQLWMGHESGNLSVYKFDFVTDVESINFSEIPVTLHGHENSISGIAISRAYSITATSGLDGAIILWDLNHTCYIRSFNLNSGPVELVVVSDTLGDVASCVTAPDSNNILHLHSINGGFLGSVTLKETVTAMCFSTAPEGVSINVIACGLNNGVIRLFSSWDLTHLRDISMFSFVHPVTSLTYSHNSQLLYASYNEGTVVAWENSGSKCAIKTCRFFNLKI